MDFQTILFYSLFQVLVIFIILFIPKFRKIANLFLGAILLALMANYSYYILWAKGFFDSHPYLVHSIFIIVLLAPPLAWYYGKAYITGSLVLGKIYFMNLIPMAVAMVFFIPCLAGSSIFGTEFLQAYNLYYGIIIQFVCAISFILYGYDIIKLINSVCARKTGFFQNLFDYSDTRVILIKVLATFIFFNGFLRILVAVWFTLMGFHSLFYYIETGIIIFLGYWVLVAIIVNPKIIHFKATTIKATGKLLSYDNSGLSDKDAYTYMKMLNNFMEQDKPYLKGDLCLADLAEKIEVPGYVISEILNRLVKQNFYDYVNNYRIEEYKRLVKDPKNKNVKLIMLAYDSGFNSKSTFNSAFKKFTGQTPSEYRNHTHN